MNTKSSERAVESAVLQIRQWILDGQFATGEKIPEVPTAERLGMSRTPVRTALQHLASEGLLETSPRRGFRVTSPALTDLEGAIEIRGVLEGLAARKLAEQGASDTILKRMIDAVDDGFRLFQDGQIDQERILKFKSINQSFHLALIEGANSPALRQVYQQATQLPMGSASAVGFDSEHPEREFRRFLRAQEHHQAIVEAIQRRQGARAQALMIEHAQISLAYLSEGAPNKA